MMNSNPKGHFEAMVDLSQSTKEDGFETWCEKIKQQEEKEKLQQVLKSIRTDNIKEDNGIDAGADVIRWAKFGPSKKFIKEYMSDGYKFIIGKEYPIFSENKTCMFCITEDDEGTKCLLNKLCFENNNGFAATWTELERNQTWTKLEKNKNVLSKNNKINIQKEIYGRKISRRRKS